MLSLLLSVFGFVTTRVEFALPVVSFAREKRHTTSLKKKSRHLTYERERDVWV